MRTSSPPVIRRSLAAVIAVLVLASLTLATAGASPATQAIDTPTPTSSGFSRPLIVLVSHGVIGTVHPGDSFTLQFRLGNIGDVKARNMVISVSSGDFTPAGTGGVIAAGAMGAGADTGYLQPLVASSTLEAGSDGTVDLLVSYTDPVGVAYSDSFTLAIPVAKSSSRPVPTATARVRPQMVITSYSSDVEPLRPGRQFVLTLTAVNVGGTAARGASLIVGGGTSGGTDGGTQQPGGVSGGSGSFETFAPLGASNVQYLGDFAVGGARDLQPHLIVNTTANPGAYPLKISFVYKDDAGASYTDDQVVTLLIYSPPVIEVSFYQPPDLFFVGQPGVLPLQVVNLDRKSVVLGRMQVSAGAGELSNNVLPIGLLDAGGYFTLDAMYVPEGVGTAELTVTVDYLDDFNQPQRITQVLQVEVMELEEGLGGEEGGGGTELPGDQTMPELETFWQKVVRFFKGLLGLDSGTEVPEIEQVIPEESPSGIITVPKG